MRSALLAKHLVAASTIFAVSSTFVYADDFDKRFFADAGISTLGASAQVGVYIMPGIAARVQANTMSINVTDIDVSSLTATGKLKTSSVGVLGDVHINGSDFFITGGAYFNDTSVTASAPVNLTGSVDINGTTYTAADVGSVSGQVEYNKISPYLGGGYRKTFANGIKLGLEAGVMHLGEPDISLDANILNATLASAIRNDLNAELADFTAEYEKDISKIQFAPVIRLSVGLSF